jgi:hypothetical protein
MNAKQRNQKRRAQIRDVEKRIEEDEFEGIFTSDQYIKNSSFVDFAFIGAYNGRKCIWNSCLTTAIGDYYEKAEYMAFEESLKKFPFPEGYELLKAEPCEWDKNGKPSSFKSVDQPEFEGWRLTRKKWTAKRTVEIIDSGSAEIDRWNIDIDESYKYGIGLHVRIDKKNISVDDVYSFIENFQINGESLFNDLVNMKISNNCQELGLYLEESGEGVRWRDNNNLLIGEAINTEKLYP